MRLAPLITLLLASCAAHSGPDAAPATEAVVEMDLLRPYPGADKVYVQVDLPGGETGVFLVDTGASTSLLTDDMAERLGVEGVATGGIIAGLGGQVPLYEGRLPWVNLGGVVLDDVAVAVGTPSLGPFSGQIPLDGILGNNVWGRLQIAIDYPADIIEIGLPGQLPVPEDAERMSFDGQHLLVPLTLHAGTEGGEKVSRELLLELDTGARGVILTEYTGPGFESVATEGEEPILGVGAAENVPMSAFYRKTRRVPLLQVELGGVTIDDPGSAIWLGSDGRSGLDMLGLVGHSVVKGHRLLLDYPGGRFALLESQREPRQVDGHEVLLELDVARYGKSAPERGLYRAKLHAALDDLSGAVVSMEDYLKRFPDDSEAAVGRARLLRYMGDGDGYWAAVSGLDPQVLAELGELVAAANWASLSGQDDAALAMTAAAVDASPEDAHARVARSDALYNSGDLSGAGAELARAATLVENPDANLMRRARLASAEGDFYGALAHLRRRLQLYPTDGTSLWFFALLAQELSDGADGDGLMATARSDLDSTWTRLHDENRPLDFLMATARILGDEERVTELLDAGLTRDCEPLGESPDGEASEQNCTAWFLALAGRDLDEATALIEGAVAADPDRSDFLDTLAITRLEAGDSAAAAEAAEEAARLAPDVIYHLWQAQRIRGIAGVLSGESAE